MAPKSRGILVTGTPGVGKTTLAEELAERICASYVEVGALIKEGEYYSGFDSERQCTIFDEDATYERLETWYHDTDGDWVVDFHSTTPMALKRWFKLIVILGCNTEVMWDRLNDRGYSESKMQENIECEIMRVIEDEIIDYFDEDESEDRPIWVESIEELGRQSGSSNIVVCKLRNNDRQDMENNLRAIIEWFRNSV